MFAQASVTLPYSSNVVTATLAKRTQPWSVALDGDGGELLAKVGLTIGRRPVYKHVRLHVGAVPGVLPGERAMLPVSWEAVGGPPIFPKMEGTLHVEPAGARATKITLNASYDPPLGKLGELIDRTVMHHVAEITMKDFIDRLAAVLTAELRDRQRKG